MIKKLFSYLKDAGIDTYLPAKKNGKCTHPYAVVDEEESIPGLTGRCIHSHYTVTVVVPLERFALLDETSGKVKAALKGTSFRFDGNGGTTANENTGGYSRVLNYRVIKPMGCKN